MTWVLLLKPKQVQLQVEVDVLTEGVGHQCLWLGFLQAQRFDMPSVLASTQLAQCLWDGKSQVSISPQWIPGPGPVAPTAVGTGLGCGVWL